MLIASSHPFLLWKKKQFIIFSSTQIIYTNKYNTYPLKYSWNVYEWRYVVIFYGIKYASESIMREQ